MKRIDWQNHILNFAGVILGVLLAFYINDRTAKKKERSQLNEMVHSLIEDLEVDLQIYADLIPANEQQYTSIENLIGTILSDTVDRDQATVTLDVKNYSPSHSTYLAIESTGLINLLGDFGIRKELSNYYEIQLKEATELGELQLSFFLNEITPWSIEHTELFDFDSEDIIGDIALANRLVFYNALIANKTARYEEIQEAAAELKEKLTDIYHP